MGQLIRTESTLKITGPDGNSTFINAGMLGFIYECALRFGTTAGTTAADITAGMAVRAHNSTEEGADTAIGLWDSTAITTQRLSVRKTEAAANVLAILGVALEGASVVGANLEKRVMVAGLGSIVPVNTTGTVVVGDRMVSSGSTAGSLAASAAPPLTEGTTGGICVKAAGIATADQTGSATQAVILVLSGGATVAS